MQRTALQIVGKAMELLGAFGAGDGQDESINEQFTDAVDFLNGMLDMWGLRPLLSISRAETSFAMTGASKYTWGPGGNLDGEKPVAPLHLRMRDTSGREYSVRLCNPSEWGDVCDRSVEGRPAFCWYDDGEPLGTLRFSCAVPADYTLTGIVNYPFTELTLPTDVLNLPSGFYLAIIYNLAVILETPFGKVLPQDKKIDAKNFRDEIENSRKKAIYGVGAHRLSSGTNQRGGYDVINFTG